MVGVIDLPARNPDNSRFSETTITLAVDFGFPWDTPVPWVEVMDFLILMWTLCSTITQVSVSVSSLQIPGHYFLYDILRTGNNAYLFIH